VFCGLCFYGRKTSSSHIYHEVNFIAFKWLTYQQKTKQLLCLYVILKILYLWHKNTNPLKGSHVYYDNSFCVKYQEKALCNTLVGNKVRVVHLALSYALYKHHSDAAD